MAAKPETIEGPGAMGSEEPAAEHAAQDASFSGPAIQTKGLSKWYGEVIAVNDVTLDIPRGITGLLGPNGAGKTTFLRMSVGLAAPSSGTIRVLGQDPWDNTKLLTKIGYVPDGDAPWRDRTGMRATVLSARLTGLSGKAAEDAAMDALKKVHLSDAANRTVAGYSRGMRQRLKFAFALLHDPPLLILDEPLIGTDPPTRRDLVALIREYEKEGRTILLSTHILPDVEAMTQHIVLLNHGRLMASGEIGEIRNLLERFPRTVRVGTTRPRELGAVLWPLDSVLSIAAEEGGVVVRTKEPQRFFSDLQEILATKDLPFSSVVSLDENVEAIFRYLVGEQK
ncbi:MAG: ABC transporter ATP-binding protein [Thermoplasmatota archaeon]